MRREYTGPVTFYIRVNFNHDSAGYTFDNYILRTGPRGETITKHFGKMVYDEECLTSCESLDEFFRLFRERQIFWREDSAGLRVDDFIEEMVSADELPHTEEMQHYFASYHKERISQEIFLRRLGIYRKYYTPMNISVRIEYCIDEEYTDWKTEWFEYEFGPSQMEFDIGALYSA